MDKLKQWMYYVIIGLVSLIALCFLPMIGSSAGLGWNTPNTTVGWIVWITVKLTVAALNVIIFHCFMLQAKLNIKDNSFYKDAQEILLKQQNKEVIPLSPTSWNRKQYSHKGIVIFITTALSTIALTQALLTFDWMSMLTYLFTIVLGIIFGIFQMKTAEEYWTDEFWRYAQMVKREMEMAEAERVKQENARANINSRTNILESDNNNRTTSDISEPVVLDAVLSDDSLLGGAPNAGSTPAVCIDIVD